MTKILDRWDLKILSEIEFNYRKPHQEIASKINRSKAFVTYRIKKMEEENVISYQPLVDYSTLGYTYYRVIVETLLEKDELMKYIKKSLHAVWLVERYDKENFVIVIAAKSFGEFQNLWEGLYESISKHILSRDISLAYKVYHFPMTFLTNHFRDEYYISGNRNIQEISDSEQNVLEILLDSPTLSGQAISKKANMSYNTYKKIMSSLKEKNVILAFQTIINKDLLDIKHRKLFFSFEFTKENKQKVIEILKQNKNVVYITETSYSYDLECEIFSDSKKPFEEILQEIKQSFPFRRIIVSQMKSEEKLS